MLLYVWLLSICGTDVLLIMLDGKALSSWLILFVFDDSLLGRVQCYGLGWLQWIAGWSLLAAKFFIFLHEASDVWQAWGQVLLALSALERWLFRFFLVINLLDGHLFVILLQVLISLVYLIALLTLLAVLWVISNRVFIVDVFVGEMRSIKIFV